MMTPLLLFATVAAATADWQVVLPAAAVPSITIADGADTLIAGSDNNSAFLQVVDDSGQVRISRRWPEAGGVCAAAFTADHIWLARGNGSDFRLCTKLERISRASGTSEVGFSVTADLDNVHALHARTDGLLVVGHHRTPPENTNYVPQSPRVHRYSSSGELQNSFSARRLSGNIYVTASTYDPQHGLFLAVSSMRPRISSLLHEQPDVWIGQQRFSGEQRLVVRLSGSLQATAAKKLDAGPINSAVVWQDAFNACANGERVRIELGHWSAKTRWQRLGVPYCRAVLLDADRVVWRESSSASIPSCGTWSQRWVATSRGVRAIGIDRRASGTTATRCTPAGPGDPSDAIVPSTEVPASAPVQAHH